MIGRLSSQPLGLGGKVRRLSSVICLPEDLGLVQGDRWGWPRHRWGWPARVVDQGGSARDVGLGGGSLEDLGLVQGDRWRWPRRDPDLAGPRPASWRPCSSAALTTSTWARAAAIPSY